VRLIVATISYKPNYKLQSINYKPLYSWAYSSSSTRRSTISLPELIVHYKVFTISKFLIIRLIVSPVWTIEAAAGAGGRPEGALGWRWASD